MRRASFLLLFLVLCSLLAAAPVRAAGTEYYGLSFDGEDDYVEVHFDNFGGWDGVTIITIARDDRQVDNETHYQRVFYLSGVIEAELRVQPQDYSGSKIYYHLNYWSDGTKKYTWGAYGVRERHRNYFTAFILDFKNGGSYVWQDLDKYSLDGGVPEAGTVWDSGSGTAYIGAGLLGRIYALLIYNRALSDEEIREIYNDPLDPPTDGLVLWLAPDSVDTQNGLWLDKSGHGNDGTIYGATYVPLRPVSESTPSQNSPYALSFDGEDDKVDIPFTQDFNTSQFTVITITKIPTNASSGGRAVVQLGDGFNYDWMLYKFSKHSVGFFIRLDTGDTPAIDENIARNDNTYHFIVGRYDGSIMTLFVDMNKYTKVISGSVRISGGDLHIASEFGISNRQNTVLVLFYSRALSDEEIKQIYENPLDPPRDGLVLFYSPYSYDPESGRWLNLAPIFPTIPLAEELDAVNYGATPERVSIPSLSVYDAQNGTPISPLNVSLSMLYNNTTTGLVPSLPVLPWNETVTLNVSATGHYPRLLTTWTGINSLAVYLQPVPGNNTTSYTLPSESDVPTAPSQNLEQPNDFGLWGSRLGAKFMAGNWSEAFTDFWTLNNLFAIVLPIIFSAGLIVMSWMVTRKPIVPIGVTAVLATFFGMIGVPLRLAVIGPLGGFFLFMLVWLGWDFYKRFERG